MARSLGSLLGVSKPTEMLLLTLLALWVNVFDMTLFQLRSNIDLVWGAPVDDDKVSAQGQSVVKYLLSGVVFSKSPVLRTWCDVPLVMARSLGSLLGVSKPTEMLLLTLLALWVNVFDMTLFQLRSNIDLVWGAPVDDDKVSAQGQSVVKYLLSGVVFVRTFTLHIYIAFLIAMFWPLYFGTRPTLMLPWLLVSAVKNIGTGIVSSLTGIYTCIMYGPMRPACLKFLWSQILELSPTFYMWCLGLSLYRDLSKPPAVDKNFIKLSEEEEMNQALRRRKVKSLSGGDENIRQQLESTFTAEDGVQELYIPESTAKMSRSLDSLLDVINAEVEMMDMEEDMREMEGLKPKEQTKKFLGITDSEIDRIRQHKALQIDLPFTPVKKDSNCVTNSYVKLLPNTNLYTPPKPLRPTRSELKSPKDFLKLKIPSDFTLPNSDGKINTDMVEKEFWSCSLSKQTFTRKEVKTETNFNTERISSTDFYSDYSSDDFFSKNDSACQVSTLSKKILEAPASEMTEKFKKSRTITIKTPETDKNPRNKKSPRPSSTKTRPVSSKSNTNRETKSSPYSRENSYLGIHLHQRELVKTFDSTKLIVDKFGIKQNEDLEKVERKKNASISFNI